MDNQVNEPCIAWHSMQPRDRDIAHCAREIERLMRLESEHASFTPRQLVGYLKSCYVFTIWEATSLGDPAEADDDWCPPMDWTSLGAVIFIRQTTASDTSAQPIASDEVSVSLIGYDPTKATANGNDPLLLGLSLVLMNLSILERTYEAPFELKGINTLRIPRQLLLDFPLIGQRFEGGLDNPSGDFLCRVTTNPTGPKPPVATP